MAAYSNFPRNPYGFLGSRPANNPETNSDGRKGPVSSYFTDGNGESYSMTVETTVQRVPPSAMPAGHYEVASHQPQIVDEFLKKIQTEVSQPARPPAMYQNPHGSPLAAPAVQFGPTARVHFGDFTNGMPGSVPAIRTKPAPPMPNVKISQAMNNITEATEYLKELARPSIPEKGTTTMPQNMVTSRPAAVNNASTPVTIDSREAARRYKNIIVSTEPYDKESSARPTLDSKTAKDKYNGAFV